MKWKDLRNHIDNMTEKQLNDPIALKIDSCILFIPKANMIFKHDIQGVDCTQPYIDTGLTEEDIW